jgi:hypothetical protein
MFSWKRIVPFLVLGPISGPLTAAITFNVQEGRPFLASLYGILLLLYIFLLPTLAVSMGIKPI